MGVRLKNSIYFHFPKTAGNWVMKSLEEACPMSAKVELYMGDQVLYDGIHVPPTRIKTEGFDTFTFVRHPLTWYQSIWRYFLQDVSWIKEWDHPLRLALHDDFNKFIGNILKIAPSYYSKTFAPFENVDFVGRVEDLPFSLEDALAYCEEDFDFDLFWHEHVNRSYSDKPAEYTNEQKLAILKSEEQLINRYYKEKVL